MSKEALYQRVLIDTGPLVAIFRESDEHHEECVEMLQRIGRPLLTSWLIIAEAAHLLRDSVIGVGSLLSGPSQGLYRILPLAEHDLPAMVSLVQKYRNLGPQVADISLVHLAGREGLDTVFTLDRRDFSIYRPAIRASFRLLPEETPRLRRRR